MERIQKVRAPAPTPAERIIKAFGGVAELQKALGVKSGGLVYNWRDSGFIPPKRATEVYVRAREMGLKVDPLDFLEVNRIPRKFRVKVK